MNISAPLFLITFCLFSCVGTSCARPYSNGDTNNNISIITAPDGAAPLLVVSSSQDDKDAKRQTQLLQQQKESLPPLIETTKAKGGKLSSVHIIDFNGFSETITNKERLHQFESRDFLLPQQYKKILRVYKRSSKGDGISLVTSYHENGQIHRYLECLNGRASGNFREWYDNGQLKIEAYVVAGSADVDEKAIDSWSFDGPSTAWTLNGKMIGRFLYKRGLLEGISCTFYETGEQEWITNYREGKKSGFERHLRQNGTIIEEINYLNGMRDGIARAYWPSGKIKYQEEFQIDFLKEGIYYSLDSDIPCANSVVQGNGIRSLFDDERVVSEYKIVSGRPEGWIKIYSDDGLLQKEYSEIGGKKQGKEIIYYSGEESSIQNQPKLSIEWQQGSVSGTVETWYQNGAIESRKEIKQNERDGVSMSWYPAGSMMMVEEYDRGLLMKGRYLKRYDTIPYSTIEKGKGVATIFDREGNIVERISYIDGKPIVTE